LNEVSGGTLGDEGLYLWGNGGGLPVVTKGALLPSKRKRRTKTRMLKRKETGAFFDGEKRYTGPSQKKTAESKRIEERRSAKGSGYIGSNSDFTREDKPLRYQERCAQPQGGKARETNGSSVDDHVTERKGTTSLPQRGGKKHASRPNFGPWRHRRKTSAKTQEKSAMPQRRGRVESTRLRNCRENLEAFREMKST